MDEQPTWYRDRKPTREYDFLALTGEGKVLMAFVEPPEWGPSNFTGKDGKPLNEWKFKVMYWPNAEPDNPGDSEIRICTENSDNFLAEVTIATEKGQVWMKPYWVSWIQKPKKGKNQTFKVFKFEPLEVPADVGELDSNLSNEQES